MNSTKYLNALLAVIAVLLLVIAIELLPSRGSNVRFEPVQAAFAQTHETTTNLAFYPWINPRRFVFWDKENGMIYIYDGDGHLDATWVVGKMGEDLKEKK
jgi:hypothetical protein